MKAWARWQDWVVVAAGLYAALAVIWTTPRRADATTLMIIFGVLMILASLWSLGAPRSVSLEGVTAVLSALLFVSPWMGGYESVAGPAWTSWITGGVGVIAALWGLEPALQAHRTTHGGSLAAHA
jgi:hypothetical protein